MNCIFQQSDIQCIRGENVEELFCAVCDIKLCKTLKQRWTQTTFSYLEKPRPDFGLMLLHCGRIDFVTENSVLTARAGDIVFLPKGCRYEAVFHIAAGRVDNYLINFESSALQTDISAPILLLKNAPVECTERFRSLVEESLQQKLTALRGNGLLFMLLDAIFHAVDAQRDPQLLLFERAKQLLLEDTLSVSEAARRCSMSESSLRALFHAQAGLSPSQFRMQARLSRAAYLLESTDMAVEEVADALHFYDAAYFCRMFRRFSGKTPRQYAQGKKL